MDFPVEAPGTTRKPSISSLSPSGLSTLVQSPKAFLFRKLKGVDDDTFYTQRGTILHDLAEWIVAEPDAVMAEYDAVLDRAVETMRPFLDPNQDRELRRRVELGIDSIDSFVRTQEQNKESPMGYQSTEGDDNLFSNCLGELHSPRTEVWFDNHNLGVKGQVDWVAAHDHLVDFKSGSRHSTQKLVRKNRLPLGEDDPDFQAISYLLHHRSIHSGESLKFTFYYLYNDEDDRLFGQGDPKNNTETIEYHDTSVQEAILTSTFDELKEGVAASNDRRRTLEMLGEDAYRQILTEYDVDGSFLEQENLDQSKRADAIVDAVQSATKDTKYVDNGIRSALRKLSGWVNERLFKPDLDQFEGFVQDRLQDVERFYEEGFPVDGIHPETDHEDTHYEDSIIHEPEF